MKAGDVTTERAWRSCLDALPTETTRTCLMIVSTTKGR